MLYEFQMNFNMVYVVKLLFLLLPVFLWFLGYERNIGVKIFWRTMSVLTLILWLIWVIYPFERYNTIKEAMINNEVCVVEGEIEDFHTLEKPWAGHDSERFRVNGIMFVYWGDEDYGYCKMLNSGGVIKGDGQKVRITYYEENDRNVICRIEELN